jgi:hypothetical protein
VRLGAAAEACEYRFRGVVCERVFLGAQVQYTVRLDSGETFTACLQDGAIKTGEGVAIGWAPTDQWVVAP